MLHLRPKSSLVDKITKIYVSRLKPLQNITIGALVATKVKHFSHTLSSLLIKMAGLMFAVTRLWEDLTAEFSPWDCYGA